jgi:hypothetical protein
MSRRQSASLTSIRHDSAQPVDRHRGKVVPFPDPLRDRCLGFMAVSEGVAQWLAASEAADYGTLTRWDRLAASHSG